MPISPTVTRLPHTYRKKHLPKWGTRTTWSLDYQNINRVVIFPNRLRRPAAKLINFLIMTRKQKKFADPPQKFTLKTRHNNWSKIQAVKTKRKPTWNSLKTMRSRILTQAMVWKWKQSGKQAIPPPRWKAVFASESIQLETYKKACPSRRRMRQMLACDPNNTPRNLQNN